MAAARFGNDHEVLQVPPQLALVIVTTRVRPRPNIPTVLNEQLLRLEA